MVHVLLKPGLENFEHYFTSMWDECNCVVVWTFFGIAFLWDWNENWPFPVLWPPQSFPNLLAYWVQHFHSIIFQDLPVANIFSHSVSCLFVCLILFWMISFPVQKLLSLIRSYFVYFGLCFLFLRTGSYFFKGKNKFCHFMTNEHSFNINVNMTWGGKNARES